MTMMSKAPCADSKELRKNMKIVITMLAVLTSAVLTSALDNFITDAVNTNEAENKVNASVSV